MDQIVGIKKLLSWKTKVQNFCRASFQHQKVHTWKSEKLHFQDRFQSCFLAEVYRTFSAKLFLKKNWDPSKAEQPLQGMDLQ